MGPELLDPAKFGLEESRTTESSDCYALGTVVYEVLSRRVPFDERTRYAVVSRVLEGGRPERPEGTNGRWFTDAVWSVLEGFWKPEPSSRPPVDSVFRCLDETSNTWTPFSPPMVEDPQVADLSASAPSDPSTEGSMTVVRSSPPR